MQDFALYPKLESAFAEGDHRFFLTYPTRIRVKKSPPNAVRSDSIHATASVQEDREHPLAQVDDLLILFGTGGFRGEVGHGVFLGNGRNDEGGMQTGQGVSE